MNGWMLLAQFYSLVQSSVAPVWNICYVRPLVHSGFSFNYSAICALPTSVHELAGVPKLCFTFTHSNFLFPVQQNAAELESGYEAEQQMNKTC